MYYLILPSLDARDRFLAHLRSRNIQATFHYQSLHSSRYFAERHDGRPLPQADRYSDCLVRLPLYAEMSTEDVDRVCDAATAFFEGGL